MMSDDSLFHRMLQNRHSYSLGGPIAQAAQQIAQIKQQATQKTEELHLTEYDKKLLQGMKVKA